MAPDRVDLADAPTSIEAVPAASGGAYRDLLVTCDSNVPCDEHGYHVWTGSLYEGSYVVVHGHRVNFAGSVHGLHALAADTDVLAEPDASSRVLARYVAGTEVAIVGTADAAGFYYVSPCNACERGFVPRSAVLASSGAP